MYFMTCRNFISGKSKNWVSGGKLPTVEQSMVQILFFSYILISPQYERGEIMTSIKFELPEKYKRQSKIRAAQDGITLTKLVLDSLYAAVPPQNDSSDNHNNVKNRIDEISAVLAKHGASMTKEERDKLKAEREQLKKDMREE